MAPTFETSGDSVFFINLQNPCDNACFLFSKVIRFFGENAYHTVDDIGQAIEGFLGTVGLTANAGPAQPAALNVSALRQRAESTIGRRGWKRAPATTAK